MGLIDWWLGLSPMIRYGVALLLLGISTLLYFNGTFWPWGWAVGGILILFAGPTDAERGGGF